MSLRDKAVSGVLWNSAGKFSVFGIEFILGIILARLLTPEEFGLIATIMVVITISNVFVNSGFSQALVRKQQIKEEDYSTAFFFNLAVSALFFFILFFGAKPISLFFKNEELKPIVQVLGIGLILNAFTIVQRSTLTRRINFKLLIKVSLISSALSGLIAIFFPALVIKYSVNDK